MAIALHTGASKSLNTYRLFATAEFFQWRVTFEKRFTMNAVDGLRLCADRTYQVARTSILRAYLPAIRLPLIQPQEFACVNVKILNPQSRFHSVYCGRPGGRDFEI